MIAGAHSPWCGALPYWLYDTMTYHNGDSTALYNQVIPRWIEKMGHVIDFDNISVSEPNTALASSVKALMRQRGCDVSVALVGGDYAVINEYFKSRGAYKTTIYPFYEEVSETMRYLGFTTNTGVADRGAIDKRAGARYGSGGLIGLISEELEFVQICGADGRPTTAPERVFANSTLRN